MEAAPPAEKDVLDAETVVQLLDNAGAANPALVQQLIVEGALANTRCCANRFCRSGQWWSVFTHVLVAWHPLVLEEAGASFIENTRIVEGWDDFYKKVGAFFEVLLAPAGGVTCQSNPSVAESPVQHPVQLLFSRIEDAFTQSGLPSYDIVAAIAAWRVTCGSVPTSVWSPSTLQRFISVLLPAQDEDECRNLSTGDALRQVKLFLRRCESLSIPSEALPYAMSRPCCMVILSGICKAFRLPGVVDMQSNSDRPTLLEFLDAMPTNTHMWAASQPTVVAVQLRLWLQRCFSVAQLQSTSTDRKKKFADDLVEQVATYEGRGDKCIAIAEVLGVMSRYGTGFAESVSSTLRDLLHGQVIRSDDFLTRHLTTGSIVESAMHWLERTAHAFSDGRSTVTWATCSCARTDFARQFQSALSSEQASAFDMLLTSVEGELRASETSLIGVAVAVAKVRTWVFANSLSEDPFKKLQQSVNSICGKNDATLQQLKDEQVRVVGAFQDLVGGEENYDFLQRTTIDRHSLLVDLFVKNTIDAMVASDGALCADAVPQVVSSVRSKTAALFTAGAPDREELLRSLQGHLHLVNIENELSVLGYLCGDGDAAVVLRRSTEQTLKCMRLQSACVELGELLFQPGVVSTPEEMTAICLRDSIELRRDSILCQQLLELTDTDFEILRVIQQAPDLLLLLRRHGVTTAVAEEELRGRIQSTLERFTVQGRSDTSRILLEKLRDSLQTMMPFLLSPPPALVARGERASFVAMLHSTRPQSVSVFTIDVEDLQQRRSQLEDVLQHGPVTSAVEVTRQRVLALRMKDCAYVMETTGRTTVVKVVALDGGAVVMGLESDAVAEFAQQVTHTFGGQRNAESGSLDSRLAAWFLAVHRHAEIVAARAEALSELGHPDFVAHSRSWTLRPTPIDGGAVGALAAELHALEQQRDSWQRTTQDAVRAYPLLTLIPRQTVASLLRCRSIEAEDFDTIRLLIEPLATAVPNAASSFGDWRTDHSGQTCDLAALGGLLHSCFQINAATATSKQESATSPCTILTYKALGAAGDVLTFAEMHRVVLDMFMDAGRLPAAVELLYATPELTVQDVEDYCRMVEAFPGGRYAVVGVHVLRPAAREVLLHLVGALQRQNECRAFLIASECTMEDFRSCGAVRHEVAQQVVPSAASVGGFLRRHRDAAEGVAVHAVVGPLLSGKSFVAERTVNASGKKVVRVMLDDAASLKCAFRSSASRRSADAAEGVFTTPRVRSSDALPLAIRLGVSHYVLGSETPGGATADSRAGVLALNALVAPLCMFGCVLDLASGEVYRVPRRSLLVIEAPVDTRAVLGEVLPVTSLLLAECVECGTTDVVERLVITPSIRETVFVLSCRVKNEASKLLARFRKAHRQCENNRCTTVVLLKDYMPPVFSDDEYVRQQLRRHVPAEFRTNFATLNRWLAVAEQRLRFTHYAALGVYLFDGLCSECLTLSAEKDSANARSCREAAARIVQNPCLKRVTLPAKKDSTDTRRRCEAVARSRNAKSKGCDGQRCVGTSDLRKHLAKRNHVLVTYEDQFPELLDRVIEEISWFSKEEQTISHLHMVQQLGYVLVPQEANILPYYGTSDGVAVPPVLQQFALLFHDADRLAQIEADARNSHPQLTNPITRFHSLIAEVFAGSATFCAEVASILDEMGYILTDDTFLHFLSIWERMQARQPYIIKAKTGVGKSTQLLVVERIVNASLEWKAKANVKHWLATKLAEALVNLRLSLSLPAVGAGPTELEDLAAEVEELLQREIGLSAGGTLSTCETLKEVADLCFAEFPYVVWPADRVTEALARVAKGAPGSIGSLVQCLKCVRLRPLFFKRLVHPGFGAGDVSALMREVRSALGSPATEHMFVPAVVFFDELNTSDIPGLLKSLLVDRIFEGEVIPDNIVFVAAVNLHERDESGDRGSNEGGCAARAGGGDRENYAVQPLHPSLQSYVQFVEHYREDQLICYIEEAVRRRRTDLSLSDSVATELTKLLRRTHVFCDVTLGMVVSQRDIQRVLTVMELTRSLLEKAGRRHFPAARLALAALYFAYCIRLSDGEDRQKLLAFIDKAYCETLQEVVVVNATAAGAKLEVVRAIVNRENFSIPAGVVLTDALAENLLVVLLTVVSKAGRRLASSVVGKPGCGKTLTVRIIAQNAKGMLSPTAFFRQLAEVRMLPLQGSSSTTARQIGRMFERAEALQRAYPHLSVVIVFDEAGLSRDDMRVLKAIHQPLDDGFVGFTCLSNRPFDDANENRMLTAMRMAESEADVVQLAYGCMGGTEETLSRFRDEVLGLVDAFQELSRHPKYGLRFHNRDFVHLCQYFSQFELAVGVFKLRPADLLTALEYNYSGGTQEELCDVAETFFRCIAAKSRDPHTRWVFDRSQLRDPTSVVLDSLRRTRHVQRHLRHRYMLLLDPADDYSNALALLKSPAVSESAEGGQPHVIFMSNFPADATAMEDARVVGEIRYYMETGEHVVVISGERILGHLFDVLNLNFTSMTDENGEVRYFANVAVGTETHECVVHDSFRITFVLREKDFLRIEKGSSEVIARSAPFMSRHEKYRLEPPRFRDARRAEAVLPQVELFVQAVGRHFFAAFSQAVTVRSAVLHALEHETAFPAPELPRRSVDGLSRESAMLQEDVFRANCVMLHTAAPEAVVLATERLEHGEAYLAAYFQAKRFSLEVLLLKVELKRLCIFTPDVFHVRRLLDNNKKDVMGSLDDVSVVVGLGELASHCELRQRVADAQDGCQVLVLVADGRARDLEFLNKVLALVGECVTCPDLSVVLVLLLPVTEFPANYASGYHLHYLDTLVSAPDVVSLMARSCSPPSADLELLAQQEAVPPCPAPTLRQVEVDAVALRYMAQLHAEERAGHALRYRAPLDGNITLPFYDTQQSIAQRASSLTSTVASQPDVGALLDEAACKVEDAVVRDALRSAAIARRNGGQMPLAEVFARTTANVRHGRMLRVLDVASRGFGLESLARAGTAGSDGGAALQRIQVLLIRCLLSYAADAPNVAPLSVHAAHCWPPECSLNPWLYRVARLAVERSPPATANAAEYATTLITESQHLRDITKHVAELPDVGAVAGAYSRDVISWAALARMNAPSKRDVEISRRLYDVLDADRKYSALPPMQQIVMATAVSVFPHCFEALCAAKLLASVYLELGVEGAARGVVGSFAMVVKDLWGALAAAARKCDDAATAANEVRVVLRVFAVVRAWLLDRETQVGPVGEAAAQLVCLDLLSLAVPHASDDAGVQRCALCLVEQTKAGAAVRSLEYWLNGAAAVHRVALQDVDRCRFLVEAFLFWLHVAPDSEFNAQQRDARRPRWHPLIELTKSDGVCGQLFHNPVHGRAAAASLIRRCRKCSLQSGSGESMLSFVDCCLGAVVAGLPAESPPYCALLSLCIDDEVRTFLSGTQSLTVGLSRCCDLLAADDRASAVAAFVDDVRRGFLVAALGACAGQSTFGADCAARIVALSRWLPLDDAKAWEAVAAHIMRVVPDAAPRSVLFATLGQVIPILKKLAKPSVFTLDRHSLLPEAFYRDSAPEFKVCTAVRQALGKRQFAALFDGRSIASVDDVVIWLLFSVYHDFVVVKRVDRINGLLEAATAALGNDKRDCQLRLLRALMCPSAVGRVALGAKCDVSCFHVDDSLAIDFAIRLVASCCSAPSPLHGIFFRPAAHKNTYAFGDVFSERMIHGWDCGGTYDEVSGQREHASRSDAFTLREQYFLYYSIYSTLLLSGVLYPEKVASWREAAVSNSAIVNIAAADTPSKLLKFVAIARQQHLMFMRSFIESLAQPDVQVAVLLDFHRRIFSPDALAVRSKILALSEERQRAEEAFRQHIAAVLNAQQATLEAVAEAKASESVYTRCQKRALSIDMYPLRRELHDSSAAAKLVMQLRDESGKQLIALSALPPLLELYSALHVGCAMQLSDADLDGGATLEDLVANVDYCDAHDRTFFDGIAAWQEVRAANSSGVAVACEKKKAFLPEISMKTPVAALVTRDGANNGLLLDVILACLKGAAQLKGKFEAVAANLSDTGATAFQMRLCEWAHADDYREAALALVPHRYGVLHESFGARLLETAEAIVELNAPEEGCRVLLAACYQLLQCAEITEAHIKRVYRTKPSDGAVEVVEEMPMSVLEARLREVSSAAPDARVFGELVQALEGVPLEVLDEVCAALGKVARQLVAHPDMGSVKDTPLQSVLAAGVAPCVLAGIPASARCGDIGLLWRLAADLRERRILESGFFEQYRLKLNRAAVSVRLSEDQVKALKDVMEAQRTAYRTHDEFVAAMNEDIVTLLSVGESAQCTDAPLAEYIRDVMGFPESLLCVLPRYVRISHAVEVAALLRRVEAAAHAQVRQDAEGHGRYTELPEPMRLQHTACNGTQLALPQRVEVVDDLTV